MNLQTLLQQIYGGRMSRKNYIYWQLLVLTASALSIILLFQINDIDIAGVTNILINTPYFITLFGVITIGQIIFSIRRLQDINLKWYWVLMMLVPYGDLFLIIYLTYRKGSEGTNEYGIPDTRNLKNSILNNVS